MKEKKIKKQKKIKVQFVLLLLLFFLAFFIGIVMSPIAPKNLVLGITNPAGCFLIDEKKVVIMPEGLEEVVFSEKELIFAHEYCHYLWHNRLETIQKEKYSKIFKEKKNFISQYAKTNESECFAEECSYLILENNKLDEEGLLKKLKALWGVPEAIIVSN